MSTGGSEISSKTSTVRHLVLMPVLTLLGATALAMVHSTEAAYSALLGGTIAAVALWYGVRRALGDDAGNDGSQVLAQLYRAEVGKLVIVAVLFVTVFLLVKELTLIALIAGYICVHISGVIALVAIHPRR